MRSFRASDRADFTMSGDLAKEYVVLVTVVLPRFGLLGSAKDQAGGGEQFSALGVLILMSRRSALRLCDFVLQLYELDTAVAWPADGYQH